MGWGGGAAWLACLSPNLALPVVHPLQYVRVSFSILQMGPGVPARLRDLPIHSAYVPSLTWNQGSSLDSHLRLSGAKPRPSLFHGMDHPHQNGQELGCFCQPYADPDHFLQEREMDE